MTGPSKFLDVNDITRGIDEITKLTGGSAALAGGVALMTYGSDRFTRDIDIVCGAPIAGLPQIKPLAFGGYQSHTPSGVPTDLIIRDDEFAMLYAEALVNSINLHGLSMPIVSCEYLAAMKLVAGRPKDLADLEFLILREDTDLAATRKIIKRNLGAYAAKDFDQHVSLAKWRATRR